MRNLQAVQWVIQRVEERGRRTEQREDDLRRAGRPREHGCAGHMGGGIFAAGRRADSRSGATKAQGAVCRSDGGLLPPRARRGARKGRAEGMRRTAKSMRKRRHECRQVASKFPEIAISMLLGKFLCNKSQARRAYMARLQ